VKQETALLNRRWAQLIVEELVRNGVDFFCISPGSRSTPLTMAVYARATDRPAVVVTTSGTAVANLLPAAVEASNDAVPMILLTADRPPELIDSGANQTIDQRGIFCRYARWFHDLPCPTSEVPEAAVLSTVDQAVVVSLGDPPGPVHLNCRFRKPLVPAPGQCEPLDPATISESGEQSHTSHAPSRRRIDALTIARLNRRLGSVERGMVVVGRLSSSDESSAVHDLVQALGWPVVADITSGLRLGNDLDMLVAHGDLILAADPLLLEDEPITILHIGGRLVSERVQRFLAGTSVERYIQVDSRPWRNDPSHCVSQRLTGDIVAFCADLTPLIQPTSKTDWQTDMAEASETAVNAVEAAAHSSTELVEPVVARLISQHIAPDSGLFLGSSMPVRDMNIFADHRGPLVTAACNRGASGIDGTIATAVGFCHGLKRPTTLLLGDLAALHDLNSLALVSKLDQPLTIVVVNNDGGGIFGFLPIREHRGVFEEFFVAPHGFDLEAAAGMFGLEYHRPNGAADFVSSYGEAQAGSESTIIEVMTDRDSEVKWHQSVIDELTEQLTGRDQ